jgi:hypothetical protein
LDKHSNEIPVAAGQIPEVKPLPSKEAVAVQPVSGEKKKI